jgi:hypothetical protein
VQLSEADLYHHFLEHTSRTLTRTQSHMAFIQMGVPTLALQNKTVFHSLLAVSAICMCVDMIQKEPGPDPARVKQVMMTGYRYYNQASEQMRASISAPNALQAEVLLSSAILLVPFAAASQQINHWISMKTRKPREPARPLAITPNDIIIMMRGIQTTFAAIYRNEISWVPQANDDQDKPVLVYQVNTPPPSRTHVLYPIVAATIDSAFSKLRQRLDSLEEEANVIGIWDNFGEDPATACVQAFEVLDQIRRDIFSPAGSPSAMPIDPQMEDSPEPGDLSIPQVGPFLQFYAQKQRIPKANEPLTSFFIQFLVHVPQSYLDIVLPLLEQRMESPIKGTFYEPPPNNLTKEQVLALDIYAHWSVLMLLIEKEAWWIGMLPEVTLTGMLTRFSDSFVAKYWPEATCGHEQWWPASMLNILREFKRFR